MSDAPLLPDPIVDMICRMVSAQRKIEHKPLLTLFRDIPWVEAKKCVGIMDTPDAEAEAIWNEKRRKPVQIMTPPYTGPDTSNQDLFKCQGPFYTSVENPNTAICIHLLSIGD